MGMPTQSRFGYVAQELVPLQGEATTLQMVVSADEERAALLQEQGELDHALADGGEVSNEKKARRSEEIRQRLEAIDADTAELRARDMLSLLGFDEVKMQQKAAHLSGGWRMRLALVQALYGRPDVLLLDEPTNHLDLHSVLWLEDHLRNEWGAAATQKDRIVVVVSHDRSFMDACLTDIIEIHGLKLRTASGNYSAYMDRIAEEQRLLNLQREEEERQEKQLKKDFQLMKKKSREHGDDKKIRQLKSKEKKAERLGQIANVKLTSKRAENINELVSKLREDQSLRFRFPEVKLIVEANLLEIDAASVKCNGKVILQDVTLTLESASRVAIVGGNGSGKSTLMRALAGEIEFMEQNSRGRKHPAYLPGHVPQNHLESVSRHLHANCIDFLRDHLPDEASVRGALMTKQTDETQLWAHLGKFGLGNDALKKLGYLSGGQKARLSLAISTSQSPNVLLLDEPTNHLDIDSLDALSLGLQSFGGAVIVVSHNRDFVEALCDELWIVRDGVVKACPKGEEAFLAYFDEYAREVRTKRPLGTRGNSVCQ